MVNIEASSSIFLLHICSRNGLEPVIYESSYEEAPNSDDGKVSRSRYQGSREDIEDEGIQNDVDKYRRRILHQRLIRRIVVCCSGNAQQKYGLRSGNSRPSHGGYDVISNIFGFCLLSFSILGEGCNQSWTGKDIGDLVSFEAEGGRLLGLC
jgi:hypothetical protein